MKIVAVTPLYPPTSRVGAWLATHELLAGLARQGHKVHVFRRLSSSAGYTLDDVRVSSGQLRSQLNPAIVDCDVVVSHCGDDGLAAELAARFDKPSVRMVHGFHPDTRGLLDGAALAVFNSKSLQTAAGWEGPQIVVPPPIRPGLAATPGDRVTLVNLSPDKGGSLFWRLARRMPNEEFLGVKGGWGIQPVYSADNVAVYDATEHMARVYAQTRMLLMPSLTETYGLVGVEALSCGIPVIAHPTPGLLESLDDAGIFVDRDNEPGWVDAIDRLSDPAEWAAMSARARARVARLDPAGDLARFAQAVGSLVRVAA